MSVRTSRLPPETETETLELSEAYKPFFARMAENPKIPATFLSVTCSTAFRPGNGPSGWKAMDALLRRLYSS